MQFSSLGLAPELLNKLKELKHKRPTPIQTEAIPAILQQEDVLGIAKTGSGKTASYVLPILTQQLERSIDKNRHVKVLVLVPTRELAIQVQGVFRTFSDALPKTIKSWAVYGGVSINPQMMAMQNVQVLVATTGRLIELVESNALSLSDIDTLVLDEADKMLNLGFEEELTRILKMLPKRRQNLLFSATLSDKLDSIHQQMLRQPRVVKIEEEENKVEQIEQVAYLVDETKKGPLLRHLIEAKDMSQLLVFCSSGQKAENVAHKLRKNGLDAESIHGKKSQLVRQQLLADFKCGDLLILVATDLLARGVDIEQLPYVINYELPRSPKDYIHRIGRTGRADAKGEAISFISDEEQHHFRVIQKKMKRWVDTIDASDIDI